jgi:hypothetical protein
MTSRRSPWRRAVETTSRKAPAVVELHPNAFADDYDMKPTAPTKVGVRLVGEGTLETARSWAAKKASRRHPAMTSADDVWCEAFNQALMQWVVARATCNPDDVTQPFWPCAEDVVPLALSSSGLQRLWEEHEMLLLTSSALSPEVDLNTCEALGQKLVSGEFWTELSPMDGRKIRRLFARALEVAGYEIAVEPPPPDGVNLSK